MRSNRIKYVLSTPFSVDRDLYTPDPEWIRQRHRLFHEFTVNSMLRQKIESVNNDNNSDEFDFEIWAICGAHHKELTDSLEWHPRVRTIYDLRGALREIIANKQYDFLSISRIDSDDLYHEQAFECIKKTSERLTDDSRIKNGVVASIFRRNICWNRINKFIGYHLKMHYPPPFLTRVYSREFFSHVDYFIKTFCVPHGSATTRVVGTPIDMRENMVCVVKHGTNTSDVRRSKDPKTFTLQEIDEFQNDKRIITSDMNAMIEMLEPYGVSVDKIQNPPDMIFIDGEFRETQRT